MPDTRLRPQSELTHAHSGLPQVSGASLALRAEPSEPIFTVAGRRRRLACSVIGTCSSRRARAQRVHYLCLLDGCNDQIVSFSIGAAGSSGRPAPQPLPAGSAGIAAS